MVNLSLSEILDYANGSQTYPDSGVLNWGEISYDVLEAWVELSFMAGDTSIRKCDVESVKSSFESWWKRERRGRQH